MVKDNLAETVPGALQRIRTDEMRQKIKEAESKEETQDQPKLYQIIYIDSTNIESIENIYHYGLPEILTEDCILFLRSTGANLKKALEIIYSWSFVYKTCMVWVKEKEGSGRYARQQHELLLIATRGEPPIPLTENRPLLTSASGWLAFCISRASSQALPKCFQ